MGRDLGFDLVRVEPHLTNTLLFNLVAMAKRTLDQMRERLETWRNIVEGATLEINMDLLELQQIETKEAMKKFKKAHRMLKSRKKCEYCHRMGHKFSKCWRRLRACLRCGSKDHKIHNCPRLRPRKQLVKSQVEEEVIGTTSQPGEPSNVQD